MSERVITGIQLMMEHVNSPEEVMKYWDSVLKQRDDFKQYFEAEKKITFKLMEAIGELIEENQRLKKELGTYE